MGDLDEQQERVTLALYGGALAALGVLLVAFVFYMQAALPLIREFSVSLSQPPAEEVQPTVTDDGTLAAPIVAAPTATAEAAPPADPRTQLLLVVASTLPGAAMIGWALAASAKRGLIAVAVAHLAGVVVAIAAPIESFDGIGFNAFLLLVPSLTIAGALLGRAAGSMSRRALQGVVILAALPLTTLLSAQFGWWIVPIVWAIMPIVGAILPALVGGSLTERRA
ncbi:MAG TPA: hypothetical protein VIL85_21610 [Thermomicrobiales bacterium]|jgi:hypothetical protein